MNANEARSIASGYRKVMCGLEGLPEAYAKIKEAAKEGRTEVLASQEELFDPRAPQRMVYLVQELEFQGFTVSVVGGHTVSILIKWEGPIQP